MKPFIINSFPTVETEQTHILDLPQCCPVSKNPQPGSTIQVTYRPKQKHIEVYGLKQYIDSFIGGQKCPYSGAYTNREMESMIQAIALHCAAIADVRVKVQADLMLDAGKMQVICWAGN